jgi:biopolymer transport protein ExbD
MQFGAQRPSGRLISLTPLIDVVFILLIFFMLAASFLDWRAVDLNVTTGVNSATPSQGGILIGLAADGSASVGGGAVQRGPDEMAALRAATGPPDRRE